MNVPVALTLDVSKIILLLGLVWGLSRMKASLDDLVKSFGEFKADFAHMGERLAKTIERVGILEERTSPRRRRSDSE